MSQTIPLACSLSAAEQHTRGQELATLFQRVQQVKELPAGYAFVFPADAAVAHALLDFIVTERACCPFFTFTLAFPAPHETVRLHIEGQEGVKEIVAATFLMKVTSEDPAD